MADCCDCVDKTIEFVSRMLNVFLTIFGLSTMGYGIYVCHIHQWATTLLPMFLVTSGAYTAFFSFLYFMFGVRSACYLSTYKTCMSGLLFLQVMYIVLLLFPASRAKLEVYVNLTDIPNEQQLFFRHNFQLAAYAFLTLTVVEFICICMAHCLKKKLQHLAKYERIPSGGAQDRRRHLVKREGRQYGNAASKGLPQYQPSNTHADMYAKYGIRPREEPNRSMGGMNGSHGQHRSR